MISITYVLAKKEKKNQCHFVGKKLKETCLIITTIVCILPYDITNLPRLFIYILLL